ncbi:MAG: glycosyltransferase family 4 protein [Acidobacteria bacterium]|nr:glycosyltransferase family 4 protein [Acidobacteriota bacterium]MBI3423625.1 glycosyltransferase family 4 protein [Acidobacteriota bacterium]
MTEFFANWKLKRTAKRRLGAYLDLTPRLSLKEKIRLQLWQNPRLYRLLRSSVVTLQKLLQLTAGRPANQDLLLVEHTPPAVIVERAPECEPPAVAIFSGTVGAARRYRCENRVDELRLAGITASVFECDTEGFTQARQSEVVVFHRVPWSQDVAQLISAIHQRGGKCLFDLDDLLFKPEHIRWLRFSGKHNRALEDEHRQLTARYFATLEQCDAVLASTQPLANLIASDTGKLTHVLRNALSVTTVNVSNELMNGLPVPTEQAILIGYLSGTPTHDYDLQAAIPGLVQLLKENAQTFLVLGGFFDIRVFPTELRKRIFGAPFQDWRLLPGLIKRLDLIIAPLESANIFTACKSEVKYIEAGIVGVPTIATATEAFQTAIVDGQNGWLVHPTSSQDWYGKLALACTDHGQRLALGRAARQDCLTRYTAEARATQIKQILEHIMGNIA